MNRFVIAEPSRCFGCNTCMAACSVVHKAVGLQGLPRLKVVTSGDRTAPVLCRHCDDAPCARVCPVKAITHEHDAIVLNETLCIGCKLCAIACPFGAITPGGTPVTGVVATGQSYVSAATLAPREPGAASDSVHTLHPLLAWTPGVRSVAVKCDLCDFRTTGPECIRVCPTKALVMVADSELSDAGQTQREKAAEALDIPGPFTASGEAES